MSSETPTAARSEFGFLRLLFASMVVFAHVPGQVDGPHLGELLTPVCDLLGFSAVDAFFLVSGYLVTLSYMKSSTSNYFLKRVLRIYPAFCVSYLVCTMMVAPSADGHIAAIAPRHWPSLLLDMIRLRAPQNPGTFTHLFVPQANAPMWTIPFEFRCYVLVAIWGWLGLYQRRWWFAAITAALLLAHVGYIAGMTYPVVSIPGIGETFRIVRLVGEFMAGTCFYLFRDRITLTTRGALAAAVVLLACLFIRPIAELGVAVAGGYLIFWAARAAPAAVKSLNTTNDISYGFYLYAWPFAQLIVLHSAHPPVWLVILADLGLAALAGTLSWFAIERPFTLLKPRGDAGAHPTGAPARSGLVMPTTSRPSAR